MEKGMLETGTLWKDSVPYQGIALAMPQTLEDRKPL
jgi:hypothetical protein